MTCYEKWTIIVSAISAFATFVACFSAIHIARYPARLKLHIWFDDEDDTCQIINQSLSVNNISSIYVECKDYWETLNVWGKDGKIQLPYELKSGNILEIEYFLRSVYEAIKDIDVPKRAKIYLIVYDTFYRRKKIFIDTFYNLYKTMNTSVIIPKDQIDMLWQKLNKGECGILSINTEKSDDNDTITFNQHIITIADFEQMKSIVYLKELPYQTKIDEYVAVYDDKRILYFSGNNTKIDNRLRYLDYLKKQ